MSSRLAKVPVHGTLAFFIVLVSVGDKVVDTGLCVKHIKIGWPKTLKSKGLKTNMTQTTSHTCPLYTKCCDSATGCCLNTTWVWLTVGMLLFLMLVMGLCAYKWCRKIAKSSQRVSATGEGTTSSAFGTLTQTQTSTSGRLRFLAYFIKLPSYTSVNPYPTPQPGSTRNLPVYCEDEPPPYISMPSDSMQRKTVCEPSTTADNS